MPYVNYYRSFTLSDCLSLCDEIFIFYTFSALENFIRAKYEQKKYLAKEWVPPKPVVPKEVWKDFLNIHVIVFSVYLGGKTWKALIGTE